VIRRRIGGGQEPIFLVTGSLGCIGAWTLHHLVELGVKTVSLDVSDNRRRLDLLLDRGQQEKVAFVRGEITDYATVSETIREHGVTNIIHLAALQIPFCKADPVTGAHVNVVGTVNVFESARQAGIRHVAYASSIAAFGPEKPAGTPEGTLLGAAARGTSGGIKGGTTSEGTTGVTPGYEEPDTLYGVYKQANEGTARVYFQDHGISSVGLRPYTVFGVGRDQGLTSEPTKAMLAAAAGESFEIAFGGRMQFHFASDVACQFIEAAQRPVDGARVFNLGTAPVSVAELVELIRGLRPGCEITNVEKALPFPEAFPAGDLKQYLTTAETPLAEGVRQTIEQFEALLSDGRLEQ
jgi:UDP-glucuronate 4-epimerase